MLGIGEEVSVFLQAVLAGSTVLLAYHCIRVLRRLLRHNLFWISIEDFLFWTGTALYLFVEIYRTSDGMIRWFFVIGVGTGSLVSYGILKILVKMYRKIFRKDKKSIEKSVKTG